MDTLQGRVQDFPDVDISSLAQQLMQELAAAEFSSLLPSGGGPGSIIISVVGDLTRNVGPAEYEPHHVAIGPYSMIDKPGLARDEEKIRSLGAVLSAASTRGATLERFLNDLASLEVQARSCYDHSFIRVDSCRFVRMLLLDACYLVVRFGGVGVASNGHVQGGYQLGNAPSASSARGGDKLESISVVRDVFYLAENQIPFFVINRIHELTYGYRAIDAVKKYVQKLLKEHYSVLAIQPPFEPECTGNLLHLLHMHFKPSIPLSPTGGELTSDRVDRWRTATEYYYFAGVKFKGRPVCTEGTPCILDVKLSGSCGVLEVPHLNINAETWRLLRNLMALEQRNPEATGSHVTAYCVFMSQLACTAIDVELLSRSGVITHVLGNNAEVAGCFTNLCKGIVFSVNDCKCNYLWPTCLALDKRFRSRHRRWMAWLQQKYFRNPWLAVGLAAAVLGLACTVVQAVYSVLSYKQGA